MRRLATAAAVTLFLLLAPAATPSAAGDEPPPVVCEGDACQGIVLPPDDPRPATERGSGIPDPPPSYANETPRARPCKRGMVRRKGRCVSRAAERRRAKAKRRAAAQKRKRQAARGGGRR